MEKDYFKDRPIESTQIDKIKIGMEVYICVKAMQPYAEDLEDLSRGYITKILTKHNHPRGIKCIIAQNSNGMALTGRIVYICDGDLILTNDGWKQEKDVNPKI